MPIEPDGICQLLHRVDSILCDPADRCPAELLHPRSSARLPHILAERPDICPCVHLGLEEREARVRFADLEQFEVMDRPPPRDFTDSADFRRRLSELAGESFEESFDLFLPHYILEFDYAYIRLVFGRDVAEELGGPSDGDRKHSGNFRIQRPSVARTFRAGDF